ncbi:MAG: glycosyltransferase [Vicinamibacteria bacterium]|nr:glycosyltransferase [Vicinamibacteria bacterium]
MRIALVVHGFPPDSVAGVEVCALRHGLALQELGHDVKIVAAARDLRAATGTSRRRRHLGLDVVEIVNNHDAGGGLDATWSQREVEAAALGALRAFAPEVVHFHHLLGLSAGLLPAARELGAVTALTLHDYWLSCGRDGLRQRADFTVCAVVEPAICARCLADSPYLAPPVQRGLLATAAGLGLGGAVQAAHRRFPRLGARALGALRAASSPTVSAADVLRRAAALRSAFGAADVVVAPSRFAAARAAESGLGREIHVVPNGVTAHPPRSFPVRPRRHFGFVGTLAPHKGAHVLVEAFRGVAEPGARLTLWGSGRSAPAYAAELARVAAGDPRVSLAGAFAVDDGERAYASMDVLVVPSLWWENAPLVVQEALAAGVPVIASAIGGVPEWVREPWGRLVPPGDAAALRAALVEAVSGRSFAEPLPPVDLWTPTRAAAHLLRLYEAAAAT